MALRDHSLDEKVINSAFREFLDKGYHNASLRKIAENAGVTVGAIQTRYPTKDQLFCSLLIPFTQEIEKVFQSLKTEYFAIDTQKDLVLSLKASMQEETDQILRLIFTHYEEARLLLCLSEGSSMEHYFDRLVSAKVEESVLFFQGQDDVKIDRNIMELLTASQFECYRQILRKGYDMETAKKCMEAAAVYSFGGWSLLLQTMEKESGERQ